MGLLPLCKSTLIVTDARRERLPARPARDRPGTGFAHLAFPADPGEPESTSSIDIFATENAHDVAATLDTYADDIVWDDITHPPSPIHGKEGVGAVYSSIIDSIPDVHLDSIRRFSSADGEWVVDESTVTGHVHGEWAGVQGGGAPVEICTLHLFRLRDGLIVYENTWFDSDAVFRQVEAWKTALG